MATTNPSIDTYIANAAEFARPILTHLRAVVHAACPEVEETINWGMPFFLYRGLLCNMAAFKQHCAFSFWKGEQIIGEGEATAMGQFGRIEKLSDLPPKKILAGYVKKAMALNETGAKAPTRAKAAPKSETAAPDDLVTALKKNAKARKTFDAFSPSHRREYVEWITEAKRETTRAQRLATTIEWLTEGKPLRWKYMNC
jgi:uncharacterized protein YdeI (YjbR/CyaY-like superfamily)